jgi:hypothetical protein
MKARRHIARKNRCMKNSGRLEFYRAYNPKKRKTVLLPFKKRQKFSNNPIAFTWPR